MKYVLNNISKTPPKNMNIKDYLFLMNKKVYDLSIKEINLSNSKNINSNINSNYNNNSNKVLNESKRIDNNVFDSQLLSQYQNVAPVIDYPKPGNSSTENLLLPNKVEEIQKERETIYPKQEEINFQDDKDDSNNTMDQYNDLLSSYNQQLMSMDNFEKENKKINKEVEDKETIENLNYQINKLTPINVLNDNSIEIEKNIQNKDITTINSFNRNDSSLYSNNGLDTQPSTNHINDNNYVNYNGKNLNFSGNNNKYSDVMIDEPNFNVIDKSYYVVFNSKWRDLSIYLSSNHFQVKFSPASNNYLFRKYTDDNNVFIINEKNIVIGDNSGNNVGETFDNIKNIELTHIIVPTYSSEFLRSFYNTDSHTTNLYKDSYLLLEIPELISNFRGGNSIFKKSFAKLDLNYTNIQDNKDRIVSNFLDLIIEKNMNNQKYSPVSGGKMDKMTLNLINKNGRLYNFGIDKLFINNFRKGHLVKMCDKNIYTTKFDIVMESNEYLEINNIYFPSLNCNKVTENSLEFSDLIYFYTKIPEIDQLAYFDNNININDITYNKNDKTIRISLYYLLDNKKVLINFTKFFNFINTNNSKINDFYFTIIESQKYNLKIKSITDNYIFVEYYNNMPNIDKDNISKIALSITNKSGNYSSNPQSLFSLYGYNILKSDYIKNVITIEIEYPYESLPFYLKNNYYSNEDLFIIQDKMQITYTFKITSNIKDYNQLDSYLNESGNN